MSLLKSSSRIINKLWQVKPKGRLKSQCYSHPCLIVSDPQKHHAQSLHLSAFSARNQNSQRPKLSPEEVNEILHHNEQTLLLKETDDAIWDEASSTPSLHAITMADSNQLASNTPIEDKLAVARCLHTTGFLFGVFDGHGGPECSQVVSKRLCDYIAASLLPRSELRNVVGEMEAGVSVPLTKVYNDTSKFVSELQEIYDESLLLWCKKLLNSGTQDFSMDEALVNAFVQLDHDIGLEVVKNKTSPALEPLLRVALSGSVACVAHIDGPHLHIASTGDCRAVLGKQNDQSHAGWLVERLTVDHNWENLSEVKRVKSEHPPSENKTVVRDQRLLGLLMPFRAFGDFRFKWDKKTQMEFIVPYAGMDSAIPDCLTPPYLTCRPEIRYHRLQPQDKFLLIASDGLWEEIDAYDAVTLVGEYRSGRQTLQPVRLPRRSVSLKELHSLLEKRKDGLKLKPSDVNAATHLIRHSLGGTEEGLDHSRISHSLTLPTELRRYFRDDISIHVVNFDSNFLRICPREL